MRGRDASLCGRPAGTSGTAGAAKPGSARKRRKASPLIRILTCALTLVSRVLVNTARCSLSSSCDERRALVNGRGPPCVGGLYFSFFFQMKIELK